MSDPIRCAWCSDDPLYQAYHDTEWGVPVHDDSTLFEFITLEGAQAGLSWLTILRKRENYRRAFDNFDIARIARYGERDTERLLADAMSKALKRLGFKFVGTTICYALMQAVGMVNDHTVDCFRYRETRGG